MEDWIFDSSQTSWWFFSPPPWKNMYKSHWMISSIIGVKMTKSLKPPPRPARVGAAMHLQALGTYYKSVGKISGQFSINPLTWIKAVVSLWLWAHPRSMTKEWTLLLNVSAILGRIPGYYLLKGDLGCGQNYESIGWDSDDAFHREPRSVDLLMGLSDFATQGWFRAWKKHIHIFCPQNLWWKIHGESNLMVNRIRNKKITNKIESKEFMNVFIQSSWLPVWGPQIAWFSLKYIPSLKLTAISETWKNGITGKGASFKHQFSVANSLIVSRRVLYSMKKGHGMSIMTFPARMAPT